MHLRSIELRHWKAYEKARFDFPAPNSDRNVILIGGLNGFGKTTLFEAIVLGLFGREGIRLISRAAAAADDARRNQSFREFMDRVLNGYALRQGQTFCRVGLTFEDDAGHPISIERTWHFQADGRFRPASDAESVKITQGLDRRVVGPPRHEADPPGWYRDWVARTFLPVTQAAFFMFDGEAASVYAERDMGIQVREGIEGLLGLTWLRTLLQDLRTYAGKRRSEMVKDATTDRLKRLETELSLLEAELTDAQEQLERIRHELAGAEGERDALIREFAGYGTGSRAQLEELVKRRADDQKAYEAADTELARLAERELPLALVGQALRARVAERIRSEIHRNQWLAAAAESRPRVAPVLQIVEQELDAVVPPLAPSQSVQVKEALGRALERLWHPPPQDAAESFRHHHLRGPIAERVLARLDEAGRLTAGKISSLLRSIEETAAALRSVEQEIRDSEVTAPPIGRKAAPPHRIR